MAKNKESGGLPDNFWRQATVLILILLSILLAFGMFGAGGLVVENLFKGMRWLLGYIAFLTPLFFVYTAILKQRQEDHKLSRSTFVGLIVFVISLAGLIHIFTSGESLAIADEGRGGGMMGHILSSAILTLFNTVTGAILLGVITLIAFHFVLRVPLTSILRLLRIDRKEETEEKEEKVDKKNFELNEGVPIQRGRGKDEDKEDKEESSDALTTASDSDWNFPPLDLLSKKQDSADAGDIEGNAEIIKNTLSDFNITVDMQGANVGPRVTQYTLKPPAGVRLTKITALENNLALNLAATSIRMEAPIPGKRAVGIEVPNIKGATVRLRGVFEDNAWKKSSGKLNFAVGKDIAGEAVVENLDTMPHLLIAGATGTGKSVMINTVLSSFLYRCSPAELKLILVDPKQVELTPYNDIPHLLAPVITNPEKCISALKWATAEMDRRYDALNEAGKRNIAEYNKSNKSDTMPYIVVVIDELADIMMLAMRDVEGLIVRLAQKSRAVGIHLVLATQRPSVDVITGLIKANIPSRIAFTVASQVDSRTIIDQGGAEKLLGQGDMLMVTPKLPKPRRIQGVFIEDKEVNDITDFLRMERAPEYDEEVTTQPVQLGGGGGSRGTATEMAEEDSLYHEAVREVIESKKASASLLQRRLRIGYARAARLIEAMEEQGIIGPQDGSRPRDVLVSSFEEFESTQDL